MSDMKKKEVKGNYIKINVESSDYGEGYSKVEIQAFEPQDFMIASLLSIKLLAKKFDTDYETILKIMCTYLKEEIVSKEALKRVENDLKEDGIENL